MDNKVWIEKLQTSLDKAKEELDRAHYLAESGGNAGIRKMNANKSDWLNFVVYLAELGLETERLLLKPVVEAVPEEPKTDYEKARILFQMIKDNPIA